MSDFSEVFWYIEGSKNLEKEFLTVQNIIFLRGFERRNTFFRYREI